MQNANDTLSAIHRPKILVRAAKIGMEWYKRERDLRRLTRGFSTPAPAEAVSQLMEAEGLLEDARKSGDAAYDIHRHISVLTALLAEARLLPSTVKQTV